MNRDHYRDPSPLYEDVWDWDIVLLHGEVRIVGYASTCLWRGDPHPRCDCADTSRLTSAVLDRFGKPLEEAGYRGEVLTGGARHLLSAGPGTELLVQSGKTYRLTGPRKAHPDFKAGSIWTAYAQADAEDAPRPSLWQRVCACLTHAAVKP